MRAPATIWPMMLANIQATCRGGCKAEESAQNLATYATPDGPGNGIAEGSEIDVLGKVAGEVFHLPRHSTVE